MPDAAATRLADTCATLLQVVADGLEGEGITVPERRYVTSGAPAYDCEQLVVALTRLYPAIPFQDDPALPVLRAVLLRAASVAVHLVRCVPTPTQSSRGGAALPTAAALDDAGMTLLTDALMMPVVTVRAWHDGSFLSTCEQMGVREVLPAEPDGGFGGTIMLLDFQV